MICPNCGANYDDHLEKCPYCHTENREANRKRYDAELSDLRKQEREMHKVVPKRTKAKLRRGLIIVFAAVVVLLAGGALVGSLVKQYRSKQKSDWLLENEQKGLQELEKLYQAGRYEELYDCTRKYQTNGAYYPTFQKYTQVYFINEWYRWVAEYEESWETGEGMYPGKLSLALSGCADVLNDAHEYENDPAILGNEDVIGQFRQKCEAFMDRLQMTEEEKQEILAWPYEDDGYDKFDALAAVLEERNQIFTEE